MLWGHGVTVLTLGLSRLKQPIVACVCECVFGLCLGKFGGMYQAKERPSSDTKYDVYFWEQSKQAKSDCKENKRMESSLKTPKLKLELLGG